MTNNRELINNINKIHTTKLGEQRIKNNLDISNNVVDYLKEKVTDNKCLVYKKGKNYYCEVDNMIVTINSYNYCIITAHLIKKEDQNEK